MTEPDYGDFRTDFNMGDPVFTSLILSSVEKKRVVDLPVETRPGYDL